MTKNIFFPAPFSYIYFFCSIIASLLSYSIICINLMIFNGHCELQNCHNFIIERFWEKAPLSFWYLYNFESVDWCPNIVNCPDILAKDMQTDTRTDRKYDYNNPMLRLCGRQLIRAYVVLYYNTVKYEQLLAHVHVIIRAYMVLYYNMKPFPWYYMCLV